MSGAGQRLQVFHSDRFNDTGIGFDTLVKADAVAATIRGTTASEVELVEPRSASLEELARVHDVPYLDALVTGDPADLASSNGIGWDERLLAAAASSTGGLRDAALASLGAGVAGSTSSGLHHARRARGEGYCTLNGLAVAACAALDAGVGRILVLDLDAHCGGGTAELIEDLPGVEQLDVSTSSFDAYPNRDDARLRLVARDECYLEVVASELDAVRSPGSIDLVLYNAGMDPHERAGGRSGIDARVLGAREQMVFDWAAEHALPIAFCLAGGYASDGFDLSAVAGLHLLTVRAAARSRGAGRASRPGMMNDERKQGAGCTK